MKWLNRREPKERLNEEWGLQGAVDRARLDWQNAHHLVNSSEQEGEIDDSIYYLQVVQKRYMFLLQQARQERVKA